MEDPSAVFAEDESTDRFELIENLRPDAHVAHGAKFLVDRRKSDTAVLFGDLVVESHLILRNVRHEVFSFH